MHIRNKTKQMFLIFILFSILLVTSFVVIDSMFFANKVQKVAIENATRKIKERELVTKHFIDKTEHILKALSDLEMFKQYINNQYNQEDIEKIFFSFSKSNSNFMQLRFIDKDGFERVRIDRKKEEAVPRVIPVNELQDKSSRYYFKDSQHKELSKVWFSALDLNIERGKVEIPYKPTLRAVLPIKQNKKFGEL